MAVDRFSPDSVYTPPNEAYAQAVRASGSTHVHVSGMVGLTPDGAVVSTDMREQATQAVEMLSRTLQAAGADVSDLVRIRILTTDVEECLDRCHEPIVGWYGEHQPASTLHEVAGLALDPLKIELEATAVVDE